jgi:hypothetical protein
VDGVDGVDRVCGERRFDDYDYEGKGRAGVCCTRAAGKKVEKTPAELSAAAVVS